MNALTLADRLARSGYTAKMSATGSGGEDSAERLAGATSVGRFVFRALKRKRVANRANEKGPTVACRAFHILVGRE
ncbi:hypothetical protein LMG18096_03386 [Ralstonia holmesii]|uniref:Uncharacterized protein n=1 Tax=Ralstonia holmesii TaxID=3058602 RepID=A0ABC8QEU5_9RALS|nr:hypothetical protein LMG18096_03386 [Ralstonia sp. LMG 32967]CAJ0806265.1 hypothetical protein LMG18093_00156 [Ralstonia sp. LMG 32967]